MGDFKQQTGSIGIKSGDFSVYYENDGTPFQKKWFGGGVLADGGDSYRSATATIAIGEFHAGVNLFTGRRDYNNDSKLGTKEPENGQWKKKDNPVNGYKYGYVNEVRTKYRLGAAYLGWGGYRIGANSEHIRHWIQDRFIHNVTKQGGFEMTSQNWNPYLQYQTQNQFTTW